MANRSNLKSTRRLPQPRAVRAALTARKPGWSGEDGAAPTCLRPPLPGLGRELP